MAIGNKKVWNHSVTQKGWVNAVRFAGHLISTPARLCEAGASQSTNALLAGGVGTGWLGVSGTTADIDTRLGWLPLRGITCRWLT